MKTLRISLRALAHPLSLASIVLLIINDHVLKAAVPSALTGKLSDFAGLFFFPFLLAALLSIPAEAARLSPRRTAALSFGVTLVWFASIKTLPWANSLTEDALAGLLGYPTVIVLDPTDLVALVVLWPAWRLWEQVARQPHGKMPRVVAALALGAAAWATMATSPCNAPDIQRVLAFENRIYIQPARRNVAFVSENETRTWQYASSLPPEALAVFQQSVSFPLERCVPKNPNTCYRIEGKSKIDFSLDGKQSWRTGWRAPTWRTEYFNRLLTASCTEFPDFAPIDLTILPLENGDYLVIATLGNQGIVTYHPAVGWQQQPVLDAEPTPTAVPPSEIDSLLAVISFESIFWTLMIFIIPIRLTSSLASKPFQDKTKFASSFAFSTGLAFFVWQWIFLPFSLIALPTLIIVLFFHTVMFSGEGGVYTYIAFLISAWLLVVYYRWLKKRISNNVGDTERTSLPPWSYISKGLVTAFLGWLPFALWAWEVIPNHWIAVGISVAASSLYYWQSIHDIAALRGE